MGFQIPKKRFMMQKPMLRVCYALVPIVLASIYLFGWRSLVMLAVILACGIAAEALFVFRDGKPVTSAVFVTCLIFHLSLPPTLPIGMAIVGIIAAVVLGKMCFGGFGMNIFNPAMVGRCFIYVTFPVAMTGRWLEPFWSDAGGLAQWAGPVDAVTRATPMYALRAGLDVSYLDLFLGNIPGSLGETSALLILLGGAWLLYVKAANWKLAGSCLLGGVVTAAALHYGGAATVPDPLATLLSGAFLFGAFFIVTEPVTGSKTPAGQWIYGFLIGALSVILRGFSNFSEGMMFSVLIMNAFVPLIDQSVQAVKVRRRARGAS